MKGKKRKLLVSIILIGVLVYLTFVLKIFNRDNLMELLSLQEETSSNFFVIFTLFSTVLLVFFVPLSWITFFSAYFLGINGYFSMLISATIAAVISFLIARLYSGNIISFVTGIYNRKERKYDLDYVSSLINKHGIWYIVYLRNTPIIPFSLTSYVAGSTKISFYNHMIGTIMGLIPSLILAVYFYTSVINISNDIKGVIIARRLTHKVCPQLVNNRLILIFMLKM